MVTKITVAILNVFKHHSQSVRQIELKFDCQDIKATWRLRIAKFILQCSPFVTLYLGSIGMDCVISELCYKGII